MSLPKLKGIPKGIAWLSMVGLLSLMFAAPAVATAGLPPVVPENPNPAGSVTFVQPSCTVDHVVANITDATPPGVGPGYAGIWYYLVSSRGAESQTPDSVNRLSSFALNSQPMAFGETVTFTVKAQLDTPEGSPQLVTIDSFTATRKNCEIQPPSDTKVTPTAPTSVDKCGTKDDTYTVPSTNGVDYLVGNKVVTAGTYPGTGSVTVVAKAKAGFMLNGTSTWTFGFTNVACEQPPVVVINPSGKVTVDCKGSGTATFDNSKSTTQVGFELVVNGNATLYSVSAGVVKQQSFSGAKSGSKVVVQDGEANELSSVVVAKCAIKPPTTVVVVPRPTINLPVPTKVQTDGGELMSSETSGSGVLPFIVGFGFLIVGGLTFKLRRREARN